MVFPFVLVETLSGRYFILRKELFPDGNGHTVWVRLDQRMVVSSAIQE